MDRVAATCIFATLLGFAVAAAMVEMNTTLLENTLEKAPKDLLQKIVKEEEEFLKEMKSTPEHCLTMKRELVPGNEEEPLWVACVIYVNYQGFANGEKKFKWLVSNNYLRRMNLLYGIATTTDLEDILRRSGTQDLHKLMGRIQGYAYDYGCKVQGNACRAFRGKVIETLPKEDDPETDFYCAMYCVLLVNTEDVANGQKELAWKIPQMMELKGIASQILFDQFGLLIQSK